MLTAQVQALSWKDFVGECSGVPARAPQFQALAWKIKPGSEQTVADLFAKSGVPDHIIKGPDGSVKGRLLQTMVLMKDNYVIRVIEFDAEMRDLINHMRQQQEVKDLEREFEKYLEVPRDMSTPDGAQKFFREAGMRVVLSRKTPTA